MGLSAARLWTGWVSCPRPRPTSTRCTCGTSHPGEVTEPTEKRGDGRTRGAPAGSGVVPGPGPPLPCSVEREPRAGAVTYGEDRRRRRGMGCERGPERTGPACRSWGPPAGTPVLRLPPAQDGLWATGLKEFRGAALQVPEAPAPAAPGAPRRPRPAARPPRSRATPCGRSGQVLAPRPPRAPRTFWKERVSPDCRDQSPSPWMLSHGCRWPRQAPHHTARPRQLPPARRPRSPKSARAAAVGSESASKRPRLIE